MAKRSTERLVLLLLDRTGALLRVQVLAEGTEHRVCFKNRMFMSTVRAAHAKYVVMCHNHSSGAAYPSKADLNTTERMRAFLAKDGLCLSDHVIIARDSFYSLKEKRMYKR